MTSLPAVYESATLALIAAACFGAAMVSTKAGLKYMPAAVGALVSIPSTATLFWCLAPFQLEAAGWSMPAVAIFAVVGLFFPALVTLLVFTSNAKLGPTVSGTVSCTAPLFAILAAVIFLDERLTGRAALGVTGIVCGVIALSLTGNRQPRHFSRWVILLPLAAAVFRGLAQMAIKLGLDMWSNPFAAGLIGYTISTLTVLLVNGVAKRGTTLMFPAGGVGWFFVTGMCNGTAVLLMYIALNKGPVSVVSPIVASYPFFTLILSALFLRGEIINLRVITGVALTVAGVVLLLAG